MKRFVILLVLGLSCVAHADGQVVKKITQYHHEPQILIDESTRVNLYTFRINDIDEELIVFLRSKIAEKIPNGDAYVKIDDCSGFWYTNDECHESITLIIKEPVSIQITPKD